MKKSLFIILFALNSFSVLAQEVGSLGRLLSPENIEDQKFVQMFMQVVEAHKNGNDPFMGGNGPSIDGFQIDKMKFAFLKRQQDKTVDIVIFNWDLALIEGMEKDEELSQSYGKDVYVLKRLDPKMIASQGEQGDQLTNFSYVLGAMAMGGLDFKPNPNYMDRSHPLRKVLGAQTLVLLSPEESLFYDQAGDSPEGRKMMKDYMNAKGGFKRNIINLMVHEMFHVKEGMDHSLNIGQAREVKTDRKLLAKQLKNKKLQELLSSYAAIVFKIGKTFSIGIDAKGQVAKLAVVIDALKKSYPNAWNYSKRSINPQI